MLAMRISFGLSLLLLFLPTSAKLINVTIDDAFGDPTNGQRILYFPDTAWQAGNGCQPCTAKPSPASNAWLGTWRDASFNPNDTATNSALGQIISASVQFTGTAVYVNCILTRSFVSPTGNSDMTFYIDDDNKPAGVFQETPNGNTSYRFGVTVFQKTDLPFGQHSVRLESGHAGKKALVLLDSITYTTDDGLHDTSSPSPSADADIGASNTSSSASSQTSSNSKTNVGVIVGAVVASLAVISGAVVGVILYLRRRGDPNRQGSLRRQAGEITAFVDCSDTSSRQSSNMTTTASNVAIVSRSGGDKESGNSVPGAIPRQPRPLPYPSNRTLSVPSWADSRV